MIDLKVTARKMEIETELHNYIERKLGRLDKYFPKRHQPVRMLVELERHESATPDLRYSVSVQLEVAGPDMHAKTATMNPHSAVDIIEVKLKHQIAEYKSKHTPRRFSVKRVLGQVEAEGDDTADSV